MITIETSLNVHSILVPSCTQVHYEKIFQNLHFKEGLIYHRLVDL